MLIQTAVLGEVEVKEEDVFLMPDGLYGFEGEGRYTVIRKQEDDVTLMWLQSADARVPCFVVFDPFEIIEGYEPVLEKSDLAFLECENQKDLIFLVIAVVPDNFNDITVNLKSPVVVNPRAGRARQVILANRDYPIRFALFADPA